MAAFLNFGKKQKEEFVEDDSDDYLSINDVGITKSDDEKDLNVRVFVLDDYESIRDILDIVRGEKTMCLIDIHLLRNKDPDELRRSIDKLRKTVEAIEGEVVGFHENWVLAAPKNVKIHKGKN